MVKDGYAVYLPEYRLWPTCISFLPVTVLIKDVFPEPVIPITAITMSSFCEDWFDPCDLAEEARCLPFNLRNQRNMILHRAAAEIA